MTFAEYLDYDNGSDVRYDLLSHAELIEVPNEAWLNNVLLKLLSARLELFVETTLIVAHVLTMQVKPVDDERQSQSQQFNFWRGLLAIDYTKEI